jgi:hypothetical protein
MGSLLLSWASGMSKICKPLSTAGLKLNLQVWIVRFMGLLLQDGLVFGKSGGWLFENLGILGMPNTYEAMSISILSW